MPTNSLGIFVLLIGWAAFSAAGGEVERGPWTGAVTASSAMVKAKLDSTASSATLLLAEGKTFAVSKTQRFPAMRSPADSRVWAFELTKLAPSSDYVYRLEIDGTHDARSEGRFRTFPNRAASFRFAFGSCVETGSSHRVFDTIRLLEPSFFMNIGDFHYQNIGATDPEVFRAAYDKVLSSPSQSELYRSTSFVYMWDDHDFGPNDSNRNSPSREVSRQVYREYVPHYALPAGEGDAAIYQAFSVGRARFILTDLRSERDPGRSPNNEAKTMMGAAQKEWFKRELLAARERHPLIFWVSSVPWIVEPGGGDSWGSYAKERAEIANFVADNDIRGLVILAGDAHMLAADDGSNSDYSESGRARIPVLHAAPLDRPGSVKGGPYSGGIYSPSKSGNGCFGLVEVEDDGTEMRVRFSGRNQDNLEHVVLSFTAGVAPPVAKAEK